MKKIILFAILFLTILNASALTVQQNTCVNISHPVRINDFPSSAIDCNITFYNPANTILVSYQEMDNNYDKHSYYFCNTSSIGTYIYDITCSNGISNKTESFEFDVTPNGRDTTTGGSLFYIGGVILLIFLMGSVIYGWNNSEQLYIKIIFFYCFWLLLITLNYVAWVGSTNYLYSISFAGLFFKWSFYITIYALFPIVLGNLVYLGYMAITVPEIRRMLEHGVPEDKAMERYTRKSSNWFRGGRYKKW